MAEQQFHRGNVVQIAQNLGPSMSHFTAGCQAVIIGSYYDQFGYGNKHSYTLLFVDGGESSWYDENQLTLLDEGGEHTIAKIEAEDEDRRKKEQDMAWIVANWLSIRTAPSSHVLAYLMRRIGITEPWGSQGEGVVYYANARHTFQLLDPFLSTQDLEKVEMAIAAIGKVKTIDVRIGGGIGA